MSYFTTLVRLGESMGNLSVTLKKIMLGKTLPKDVVEEMEEKVAEVQANLQIVSLTNGLSLDRIDELKKKRITAQLRKTKELNDVSV